MNGMLLEIWFGLRAGLWLLQGISTPEVSGLGIQGGAAKVAAQGGETGATGGGGRVRSLRSAARQKTSAPAKASASAPREDQDRNSQDLYEKGCPDYPGERKTKTGGMIKGHGSSPQNRYPPQSPLARKSDNVG